MYYLMIEKPKGFEEKKFDTFKQLDFFLSKFWKVENKYSVSTNNSVFVNVESIWRK